jgi:hypothetical protein
MKSILFAAAAAALVLAPTAASAKVEKRAMLSKSCSMDKVKSLAGDAIVKVEKGASPIILNITLDTGKMTWQQLTVKMNTAACFK